MEIDEKKISYMEDLSQLTLSGDEKDCVADYLQKKLDDFAKLNELDTNGVPERCHPFDNVNISRDDKVHISLDQKLVLKNAPVKNDEFFIAPKTVE